MKGYLVSSGWGGGKNYFFKTLEEAIKCRKKKPNHWRLDYVEVLGENCYGFIHDENIDKQIKERLGLNL